MIFSPLVPMWLMVVAAALPLALIVWRAVTRSQSAAATVRRVAMVLLLVAMAARPGIPGEGVSVAASTETDVFFVVDTTTSVLAEDYGDGVRWDGMKADLGELILQFAGSRMSLITFDASAVIRVPLTTDSAAVQTSVNVLNPEFTLYSRGSSISEPRELLLQTLESARSVHPERARLVFYLGDGEHNREGVAESFAAIRPYVDGGAVLGYGTARGGPMMNYRGWFNRDSEDPPERVIDRSYSPSRDALSRIDEAALKRIAGELGVGYQHRTAENALAAIEMPVPSARSGELSGGVATMLELYWVPALALFPLLLIEADLIILSLLGLRRSVVRTR